MLAKDLSLEPLFKLLRLHILPLLPSEVRRSVGLFRREGLRRGCNCYLAAGACYLIYLLKRIWIQDCIVVYPDPLRFGYLTWKLAMLSGYKVVQRNEVGNSTRLGRVVATLCHHDADYQLFDPDAINGRCVDITKSRVDEVFRDVFGYSLMIDPTCYIGQAVRKSDANCRHDGVIIDCPIGENEIEVGIVYQKLVGNELGNGLVRDFRVCVIGSKICGVEERYRGEASRFKMRDTRYLASIAIDQAFSEDEETKMIVFCKEFGLDVGELDVLRDNADGRLYIVDANKTSTTFGARRPWCRFWSWRRRARVFRSYVRTL